MSTATENSAINQIASNKSGKDRSGKAFLVLAIVQSMLIFTITMIAVPLPQIAKEFTLSSANLVLVSAAYGLPFSGLLLFGGRLADRYGGRKMFVIGLFVFCAASMMAAFSLSFNSLVAARVMQGIGAAMAAPAAMAVLKSLFPDPADFGRAMATWGGVSVLGSALGFIISGVVTSWVSWRWMFVVPVVVASVALLLTQRLFPSDNNELSIKRPSLDLLGAIFATLGISIGSYGLIVSGDLPWSSNQVYVPLLAATVLLVIFFAIERRVRDPLLPPGFVLERRRIVGLVGIMLAAAAAGGLVNFVLSLYLQQVKGWSPIETAAAFVPFAVVLLASGQAAATLVGRFGGGGVTIAGLLIAALGLGLLAGIGYESGYLFDLLPGLVLLAAGASLIFSGSAVLSTANVPIQQAGLAGGVMNTAMELGPTVGLASLMSIAATRMDTVTGYAWAFGSASVICVVVAIGSGVIIFGSNSTMVEPSQS